MMAINSFSRMGPENPVLVGAVLAALALLVPFSYDIMLALYAWAVLAVSILLLRRVYGPAILLMALVIQFAQASAILVQGAILGLPIVQLPEQGPWIEHTEFFALTAMLCLAIGMRLGSGTVLKRPAAMAAIDMEISPEAALRFYLLTYAAAGIFAILGKFGGAATFQLVLNLGGVRWVGLFVLFYASLRPGGRPLYAVIVLAVDVGIGLTGFFASFKETFYVAFLAILVSGARITAMRIFALTAMMTILFTLMGFWSAIKTDYRQFLNRGSGAQVVTQELGDRIDYIVKQVENVDGRMMQYGFTRLLDRVSYVYYLGRTMQTVPALLPHEDGALLGAAVMHILTPRLLFPEKAALPSDSVVTAKYANMGTYYVRMAGSTSISIGYLGELYVDFGEAGALMACVILGLLYGRIHRSLCDYRRLPAYLNYGVSVMVLLNAVQFEQALIKTIGSVIASLIIALLLRRYVLPWIFVFATEIDTMVRDQFQRAKG